VDDILIIYNPQRTNIHESLNEFNAINPKLKFTIEEQSDYTINFLDLTITNRSNTLDCSIFRKPTATIIHNASCHPNEHKKSVIRYLNNRVNTYRPSEKNKKREQDVIEAILRNNGYYISNILSDRKPKPSTNMTVPNNGKKYITFTYHDLAVRMITKLFKNTEIKIAYKTMNTLRNHLQANMMTTNKYELSGVYRLKCGDCPHIYIGQMGRPFKT
jgi:hypothetical protein